MDIPVKIVDDEKLCENKADLYRYSWRSMLYLKMR